MKKIVWIVLTVCLAGIFAGCDKDEAWNPFVGTTWKHRNEEVKYGQVVYTYDVIRFVSKSRYAKWKEDSVGNKISSQYAAPYRIDRSQSAIILDPNHGETVYNYSGAEHSPTAFWYTNSSGGKTYYYRQ